jgi:hypothetical protein
MRGQAADDDYEGLLDPGKLKTWLRDLDGEEFADVKAAVAREDRRRSQKAPERMSDSEHAAWVADQIKRADQAKADGAARKKATANGE